MAGRGQEALPTSLPARGVGSGSADALVYATRVTPQRKECVLLEARVQWRGGREHVACSIVRRVCAELPAPASRTEGS